MSTFTPPHTMSETGKTIRGKRKLELGAGRPKVTDLIKDGRIKPEDLDPATGLPKTPQSPKEKVVTRNIDGTEEVREISRGYVRNPDNPKWRIGFSPEKYLGKIQAELDFELRKGRRERVAPDLYPEEIDDFLPWLDEYVKSDPVEGVPEHPTIKRYLREIERRKPKGKGKASLAQDAAV